MSYDSTINGLSGLVARWKFDEAASTGTAADATGNGHTATVNGTVTQGATGLVSDGGKSVTLLGTSGNHLSVASSADWNLGTGDFAIGFWVKTTGSNHPGVVVGGVAGSEWWAAVDLGQAQFGFGGSGRLTGTTFVNDGSRHLVILTRVSGTLSIFVDGETTAEASVSFATAISVAGVLTIDDVTGGGFGWVGTLDDLFILKGSGITGTQSQTIYNAGTSSSSITVTGPNSATTLPSNHAGNITVSLVGSGTAWTGSTTWTASGVAGWSVASKTFTDSTHYAVVLTPPTAATPPAGATGTLTLTEGVTGANTGTIAVATPTLAISPTSGTTGTTPTLTLTGANTLWQSETAAGLFTVTGGTGASFATPTVTTNAAATDVLTVGSAAGSETIKDASTGATATFTAGAPSGPSAPTLSVNVGNTDAQVNLTIGTISGGTAPYSTQLQRSAISPVSFSSVGSPVVGTTPVLTDTTASGRTAYAYRAVVTDANSLTANSNTLDASLWQKKYVEGWIGDSITYGYASGGPTSTTNPPYACANALATTYGPRQSPYASAVNQGVIGSASADWVSGSTNLVNAKSAFASASVTHVHVMLGTNDAKVSGQVSVATYQSNLTSMVADLIAAGYKVIIHYPIWLDVNGSGAAGWDITSVQRIEDYQAAIDAVVSGRASCYAGDKSGFDFFAANAALVTGDGVHPTTTGSPVLGNLWAAAFYSSVINPGTSGGGLLLNPGMTGRMGG